MQRENNRHFEETMKLFSEGNPQPLEGSKILEDITRSFREKEELVELQYERQCKFYAQLENVEKQNENVEKK